MLNVNSIVINMQPNVIYKIHRENIHLLFLMGFYFLGINTGCPIRKENSQN